MAEADQEKQHEHWTIDHIESPHFRTVFASGAIFTGPLDGAKHWSLTFYTEGAKVVSETLIGTPDQGFRNANPPVIEAVRIRRDEVSIIMTEAQLLGIVTALAKKLEESQK